MHWRRELDEYLADGVEGAYASVAARVATHVAVVLGPVAGFTVENAGAPPSQAAC
jgi:hypothetical protein